MGIRTTAIEAAEARGWSKAELAKRTGLSLSTIYSLAWGSQPGPKATAAIMRVFPDLPYERLFIVSPDSRKQDESNERLQDPKLAEAAA